MFGVVAFRFVSIGVMSCMASAFVVVIVTVVSLIALLIPLYVRMHFGCGVVPEIVRFCKHGEALFGYVPLGSNTAWGFHELLSLRAKLRQR